MKPPDRLTDLSPWVVNLDARPDRWAEITRHLTDRGLAAPTRWRAIDGNLTSTPEEIAQLARSSTRGRRCIPGCVGHAKTFLALLHHLLTARPERPPWTLVLEDDAQFCEDVHARYAEFVQHVPDDALMILLGGAHSRRPDPLPGTGRLCWRVKQANASHAFLISDDALAPLLTAHQPLNLPFDVSWNAVHALGRTYCPSPHLAIQPDGYSDIARRVLRLSRRLRGPEYS